MTLRGLADGVAGWFGRTADVELVDWAEFERRVGDHAGVTREHVSRSIAASIGRAREVLGYRPRYSALEALRDSVRHLAAVGELDLGEGVI